MDATIEKKESKLEKVSAELVTEEMKNKAVADTNIFGKPKMITVTPQEYRSWQKSAETKESNEAARSELRQEKNRLYEYKRQLDERSSKLDARKKELDTREKSINEIIDSKVEAGIQEQMPTAIKEAKAEIKVTKASLTKEKKKLSDKEAELNEREKNLDKLECIIKEKITNFFNKFLMPIFKRFEAKHQQEVLAVLDQQMIDRPTAQKLHKIGYPNMEGRPFEDALDIAEERDIFDLFKHYAPSLDAHNVTTEDYNAVIDAVRDGTSLEVAAKSMAEKLTEKFIPSRRRGHGR